MKKLFLYPTKLCTLCTVLFCLCSSTMPRTDPSDRLLTLATSYRQVEKTIALLKPSVSVITCIPCISPLYPEDLRRISVSSYYGQRLHPLLHEYKHHSGIDLPGNMGEPVHATADGTIIETGETPTIGKFVRIRHAYGFTTLYGHLNEIHASQGDTVRIGRTIGRVGSTGRSTGPHLHYAVAKNGKEQNPLPYCYLYLNWQKMLNREGKK